MIFDVENWLWNSNFGTFWHLFIKPICKIQWFLYDYSYFLAKNHSLENSTTSIAILFIAWYQVETMRKFSGLLHFCTTESSKHQPPLPHKSRCAGINPCFNILLHTQSIVYATVDSQCLKYLGWIILAYSLFWAPKNV